MGPFTQENFAIVFDLDDTLYLERDFAAGGYRAAAALLEEPRRRAFAETCLALLDAGERSHVLDRALDRLGIAAEPALVATLVEAYRDHAPEISLAEDAERCLSRRSDPACLGLITDGRAQTQEAKIDALDLRRRFSLLVCTGRLGPGYGKPHPRAFMLAEAWAAPTGRPLVYVADNPLKDFVTPRERGWLAVRIARPGRIHLAEAPEPRFEPHATLSSLDDLDAVLDAWNGALPPRAATMRPMPERRMTGAESCVAP